MRSSKLLSVPILAIALTVMSCGGTERSADEKLPPPVDRDLPALAKDGTLNVLMAFNSTSYFIYRGEPMGFEYELLEKFAEDHDLKLSVEVVRDAADIWPALNKGEADVAAARVYARKAEDRSIAYTQPIHVTSAAVVQRVGEAVKPVEPTAPAPKLNENAVPIPARTIDSPADLAGRKVWVPNRSALEEVLVEVQDEITGDIEVVEVKGVASAEPLIRKVVSGEIGLTAAAHDVAQLKSEYFENLAVKPTLGPDLQLVWGVRANAPRLLEALNKWIDANRPLVRELYEKYYVDRPGLQEGEVEIEAETGKISEYDDLMKRHAAAIGWDWRLLASQTFQESRFDPDARSWAGAVGLLQLMPGTAREVGVGNSRDPDQNVAGAVRYIGKLEKQWKDEVPDPKERLKFVLASYNAGRGHVLDAQRLATKNGQDPKVWDNVAYWMLQKSKRSVYNDPVVKHGFVRGLEPVEYVDRILARYDHFQEVLSASEAARRPAA